MMFLNSIKYNYDLYYYYDSFNLNIYVKFKIIKIFYIKILEQLIKGPFLVLN